MVIAHNIGITIKKAKIASIEDRLKGYSKPPPTRNKQPIPQLSGHSTFKPKKYHPFKVSIVSNKSPFYFLFLTSIYIPTHTHTHMLYHSIYGMANSFLLLGPLISCMIYEEIMTFSPFCSNRVGE